MDRSRRITYKSSAAAETIEIGYRIGSELARGAIICLYGDLGAGKTTLVKGIASSLTCTPPEDVCSPTFNYLSIYEGKCPLYHFDLYRIHDADAFLSLGFEEYLFADGVCCIEWSERIAAIIPQQAYSITITHAGEGKREITVSN